MVGAGGCQQLHADLISLRIYAIPFSLAGDLVPGGYIFTHGEGDKTRLSQFVDFVVCIGGDGVLLHTSHLFKHAMPPVS